MLANFDIWSAAGGKNRAVSRTFSVPVSGGLQIKAAATLSKAQFNGIEVRWPGASMKAKQVRAADPEASVAVEDNSMVLPAEGGEASSSGIWPWAWAHGNGSDWVAAPELVDGDTNTVWVGNPGESPWSVALDFEESIPVQNVNLLFCGTTWTNMGAIGTSDLLEWRDLSRATNWPMPVRALFFEFRDDGSETPPAIREIQWEEQEPEPVLP